MWLAKKVNHQAYQHTIRKNEPIYLELFQLVLINLGQKILVAAVVIAEVKLSSAESCHIFWHLGLVASWVSIPYLSKKAMSALVPPAARQSWKNGLME